jgi:uncharacterized protein DUF3617
MRNLKWTASGMIALFAAASCSAQHKFPLRPGEWAMTSPDSGSITLLFCLNDEMWEKALTQNPICTVQQFSMTMSGASYYLNCPAKSFQMKGPVTLTFDGLQHMVGKAVIDMTIGGKTTTSTTVSDYRWKGATCSPDDMNMRPRRTQ